MRVLVGTSGYNYGHWVGVFYPRDLRKDQWLEYYTRFFNTVELNVSFYRLPQRSTFLSWKRRTPEKFRFVVKGSRFITHIKKLKDCQEPVKVFFNNISGLEEKLDCILWQLPPQLAFNDERLKHFCKTISEFKLPYPVRHSFEFRHQSWFCQETYSILENFGHSLCIAHSDRWPLREVITADFIYLRFHGGEALYRSNYSDEELKNWAEKVKNWKKKGKDIYAYFNNDAYGFAVKNALRFKELLQR